jgi:hypothetical protein
LVLYAGLTLPLGILAHIIAEALALHQSVAAVAVAPLHAYLGVTALACLAVVLSAIAQSRGDLRRLTALAAHALPFEGKGAQFAASSALAQFLFASLTLLCEGSLDAGNALIALAAVAFVSILVAVLLAVVRARIEHIDESTFAIRRFAAVRWNRRDAIAAPGPYYAFVPARGNRPPPLL